MYKKIQKHRRTPNIETHTKTIQKHLQITYLCILLWFIDHICKYFIKFSSNITAKHIIILEIFHLSNSDSDSILKSFQYINGFLSSYFLVLRIFYLNGYIMTSKGHTLLLIIVITIILIVLHICEVKYINTYLYKYQIKNINILLI